MGHFWARTMTVLGFSLSLLPVIALLSLRCLVQALVAVAVVAAGQTLEEPLQSGMASFLLPLAPSFSFPFPPSISLAVAVCAPVLSERVFPWPEFRSLKGSGHCHTLLSECLFCVSSSFQVSFVPGTEVEA